METNRKRESNVKPVLGVPVNISYHKLAPINHNYF
jgi:hypothetical protein